MRSLFFFFQALSEETDYVIEMEGWASLDGLIQSISKILVGLRKLELSSDGDAIKIKTTANEIDQKLITLQRTIQSSLGMEKKELDDYA